eukprot:m.151278 g.151278  ORF g.151278 m.151278 type:complete len:1020 (-) comp20689_c3_seq1:90-3149(-)
MATGEVTLDMVRDSQGLTTQEVMQLQERWGFNEIKDRSKKWPQILWEQVYGEHWYPNSIPGMMWIAIIASLAIEDFADAGVIMGLHAFNSTLSFYETMKAGDAVAALRAALAPSCNVKRDGNWVKILARELVPGDLVLLKIGDVVPADGILLEGGTMDLDQSGLTGESLPVKKEPGDTVFSGTVVKRGEQEFVVTGTGENTEMGKGVALIQSVESKGQVEVIMNRISLFLVIFAVFVNILLIIVEVTNATNTLHLCSGPEIRGCYSNETRRVLSNFIVLMVAAIPIATPVVVTATMALGARKMAAQSAVVTRLSAIEELAGMTTLCSDKTGTLTKNILTIDDPVMIDSKDPDDMILKAALAAKNVEPDAIDKCILNTVKNPELLQKYEQIDFLPFDPVIKRTEATIRGPDGRTFKTSKGAPQIILGMAHNSAQIKATVDQAVVDLAGRGLRPVAVAETDANGNWVLLGLISLFDPPRDDTKIVIEQALALGSSVKMITGDHLLIAKETCRRLGMGDSILRVDALDAPHQRLLDLVENVDGFAEVFPENKFDIVALYQEKGHITGMTGDGVNDAPALRKANVGFAVEGATPAAQGAASVILLTPGLSVIITAIKRSRKIFQRLQNYLIYRVFMSVLLLFFFFVAIAWVYLDFPTILIIFMCLILDLATMSLAYDKVIPSPKPNRWDLRKLITIATVMGFVAGVLNIILLSFMANNSAHMSNLQEGVSTHCSVGQGHDSCVDEFVVGGRCNQFFAYTSSNKTLMTSFIQLYPLCAKSGSGGLSSIVQGVFNNDLASTATTNVYPFFPAGKSSVPDVFSLHAHPWKLSDLPYSSAVINTVMFLALCLTCNFAVFSCRCEDLFFKRRPGYVLLAIISTEMLVSTLVAALIRDYPFWDPDQDEKNIRLTGVDGRYVLADWLFAAVLFLFLEGAKMATYKVYELANHRKLQEEAVRKQREENRRRMTMTGRRPTLERSGTASSSHAHGHGGAAPRRTTYEKQKAPTGQDALHQPLLDANAGDSEL